MNLKVTLGRPLAATLLLGALLLAGGLTLLAGIADLSAAQDERDAKSDFLVRGRSPAHLAGAPVTGAPVAAPLSVLAASQSLAAARLDGLVRASVATAGGVLLSIEAQAKPQDDEPPGRIEVEAVIEARNDALQAILFHLESGTPLIMVETLDIAPAAAEGGDAQDPMIRASLTLSAFWQVQAEPGALSPTAAGSTSRIVLPAQ